MDNIDPLLTASESAQYLQISVPTFWRRVADGTVPPAVKIGCLSRWPRSEIVEVIEDAKSRRFEPEAAKKVLLAPQKTEPASFVSPLTGNFQ